MQYAVLLYVDAEDNAGPESPAFQESLPHHQAFAQGLTERGLEFTGAPLHGSDTATSMRRRGGDRLVTDGPFAETKEQLWGFYLVEAPDLDTVIEVCDGLWEVDHGSVEIRPVVSMQMPAAS